jgi:hypothetical protein
MPLEVTRTELRKEQIKHFKEKDWTSNPLFMILSLSEMAHLHALK